MFWALGAVFEVLLALLIMPTLGWRWLVGLSTLPMAIFVCLCYVSMLVINRDPQTENQLGSNSQLLCVCVTQWLPESPRFDVLSGKREKALATLAQIAKDNGTAIPEGTIADHRQVSV